MIHGDAVELSLKDAARHVGASKSTMLRLVRRGRLSARRTDDGVFMVDASEVARLFPSMKPDAMQAPAVTRPVDHLDAGGDAAGDAETRIRCATLEAELRAAQTLLEAAKRREEDLRQERDAWRQQAERLAIAAPASRSWRWPWRR